MVPSAISPSAALSRRRLGPNRVRARRTGFRGYRRSLCARARLRSPVQTCHEEQESSSHREARFGRAARRTAESTLSEGGICEPAATQTRARSPRDSILVRSSGMAPLVCFLLVRLNRSALYNEAPRSAATSLQSFFEESSGDAKRVRRNLVLDVRIELDDAAQPETFNQLTCWLIEDAFIPKRIAVAEIEELPSQHQREQLADEASTDRIFGQSSDPCIDVVNRSVRKLQATCISGSELIEAKLVFAAKPRATLHEL